LNDGFTIVLVFFLLYLPKFNGFVVGVSNTVLRRIFGRERDEVTGEWRNEEHRNSYSDVIRMIRLSMMGKVGVDELEDTEVIGLCRESNSGFLVILPTELTAVCLNAERKQKYGVTFKNMIFSSYITSIV
jgi:hypothetical protein